MKPRVRFGGLLVALVMPLGAVLAEETAKPEIPPDEVAELVRHTLVPDPLMRQQFLMILRGCDDPDLA